MLITAVDVSACHVFEEALQAEIITSDLQLFDFCGLLLLAQGQTVLSFLPASGLGELGGGSPGPGVVLLSREDCWRACLDSQP